MTKLKLAILLCGVLGLVELAVPFHGGSMLGYWFQLEPAQAVVITAAFALPIAMMALALSRPPMRGWQAGVALAGFVIAVIKFRVWETLGHLGSVTLHGVLLLAALVVGAVLSLAALLQPEA
ncbi:MAG TPA: hypothetical protein VGC42_01105 [Kofleriaceae bacterium]